MLLEEERPSLPDHPAVGLNVVGALKSSFLSCAERPKRGSSVQLPGAGEAQPGREFLTESPLGTAPREGAVLVRLLLLSCDRGLNTPLHARSLHSRGSRGRRGFRGNAADRVVPL